MVVHDVVRVDATEECFINGLMWVILVRYINKDGILGCIVGYVKALNDQRVALL